jgi:hypothetical protein
MTTIETERLIVRPIDNAARMPDQEQGGGVAMCTTLRPWSVIGNRFRHTD